MEKLILVRKGSEVYHNDVKLPIAKQAKKGPGNECVKIAGLPGSNGQQWLSLSKLNDGANEILCQGRVITNKASTKSTTYTLTPEEAAEVEALQAQIDIIIDAAKARYVPKPDLSVDPTVMSEVERLAKIEEIKKYYGL